MPTFPSFIRSILPSSASNSQSLSNRNSNNDSDQASATIPPGTITVTQTSFNGSQIPTITEPLDAPLDDKGVVQVEPITETNHNAPPAAKPMDITPAAALAANPVDTVDAEDEGGKGKGDSGMKRSKSKRLSKTPGDGKEGRGKEREKERSEAYNAFWRKLIGVSPRSDKGKGTS